MGRCSKLIGFKTALNRGNTQCISITQAASDTKLASNWKYSKDNGFKWQGFQKTVTNYVQMESFTASSKLHIFAAICC